MNDAATPDYATVGPLEPAGADSCRSNGKSRGPCGYCGGPLSGRQKAFCSDPHRMAFYDQQHPRINRGPRGPREGTLKALILAYLADGQWRTEQQIADEIHGFAHSVGARLSELRRAGQPIEVDPPHRGGGVHRYRLLPTDVSVAPDSIPQEERKL
jgi:hypothetical protein